MYLSMRHLLIVLSHELDVLQRVLGLKYIDLQPQDLVRLRDLKGFKDGGTCRASLASLGSPIETLTSLLDAGVSSL